METMEETREVTEGEATPSREELKAKLEEEKEAAFRALYAKQEQHRKLVEQEYYEVNPAMQDKAARLNEEIKNLQETIKDIYDRIAVIDAYGIRDSELETLLQLREGIDPIMTEIAEAKAKYISIVKRIAELYEKVAHAHREAAKAQNLLPREDRKPIPGSQIKEPAAFEIDIWDIHSVYRTRPMTTL